MTFAAKVVLVLAAVILAAITCGVPWVLAVDVPLAFVLWVWIEVALHRRATRRGPLDGEPHR